MIALADPATARRSNLAIALISLPKARRADALIFFRFCRAVDDIADEPGSDAATKRQALEEWLRALNSGQGLPPDLEGIIRRHDLDRALLCAVVEGCLRDIGAVRIATFDELRGYCWQVAGAVGVASARIFGCTSPETRAFATQLGNALQFTNICRDVDEDATLDRIYLPADLLEHHGVDAEQVLNKRESPGLRAAVAELADRACKEFAAARASLPGSDAAALRPACMMAALYWRVLLRIQAPDHRIFGPRVRLPAAHKLGLLAAGLILPPHAIFPH